MKKFYILTLAIMMAIILAACSTGSAEDVQLTTDYLPEGVEFVRTENDDGFTEHKYRDTDGEYTLLVDKDNNVRALEYDAFANSTAQNITLSAEDALEYLKAVQSEAELIAAVEDRDDARYEWDLLITAGDDLAFYELDAETGAILDYEIFYGIASTIDLAAILESNMANASVIEISLDADDGRLYLEGEARTDNGLIEFKIDAESGILIEAEYND